MIQNKENGEKPHFGPDLGLLAPNSYRQIFFFWKIWLCQSLDIMVNYHYVLYQKKLIIQSWKNLVTDGETDEQMDGRTDGQTEGGTYRQMDESDFIERCPTNVERPTRMLLHNSSCVE